MAKPRIIFFGTPEFAVPALSALVTKGHRDVIVVTQPDKPAGRGLTVVAPPIKIATQALGLKILQPKTLKSEETISEIKSCRAKSPWWLRMEN